MPRIGDHSLRWLTDHPQSGGDKSDRHKIYQHEHAFESRNALCHPRHNKKERLCDRWVDCVSIFFAVNVWINVIVTQASEPRINRNIEVRIDAGSLNPSIPDVAVNIG